MNIVLVSSRLPILNENGVGNYNFMHKKKGRQATHKKKSFISYKDLELTKRLWDIILYAVHKDNIHTEIT